MVPFLRPPVINTLPSINNVVCGVSREVARSPLSDQRPVAGSYSSVLASDTNEGGTSNPPPATSTFPLGNKTPTCSRRPKCKFPPGVNTPVDGLKISELASSLILKLRMYSAPAAINTFPFGNKVAVFCQRVLFIGPTSVHVSEIGSYTSALAVESWEAFRPPATKTWPFASNTAVC